MEQKYENSSSFSKYIHQISCVLTEWLLLAHVLFILPSKSLSEYVKVQEIPSESTTGCS